MEPEALAIWCLTSAAWERQFDESIRNSDGDALLNTSTLFDFRPLAGDARLYSKMSERTSWPSSRNWRRLA